MNGYGYNTGGALYGPQAQRSDAMTLALMGQNNQPNYSQPAQQGGGMNPMSMAMMGNNMFGGGAGGAAAGGGAAASGSAPGGAAAASGFNPGGGASGGASSLGWLGPAAAIAAAVAATKGYESRNPDSTFSKTFGRFNMPTLNQIMADPKHAGVGALTGTYPLMYDRMNDEAKSAKPEWEELLGY